MRDQTESNFNGQGNEPIGFAAGTLVHTKEGILPIECIKVGDWVLSQPEAKRENIYKRVAGIST